MIIPTAASAVFVSTYTGLLVYGVASMNLVFGADETLSILFPSAPTFIDRIVGGYVRQVRRFLVFLGCPKATSGGYINRNLFSCLVPISCPRDILSFYPFILWSNLTQLQDLNVRLFFSLPLVGPALILLRTRLFEQTSALTLPLVSTRNIFKLLYDKNWFA